MTLTELNQKVISCRKCPRLVAHREEVAVRKVRRFQDQLYWGRPVPGFGDLRARALIVGLAPAAHGANRTGRMFTGDSSGDWLYKALHETGFANQPESCSADDGLTLNDIFITASVRCAPPQNKPEAAEILNCRNYLVTEIELFQTCRLYIALGQIAYKNLCEIFRLKKSGFAHNRLIKLPGGKLLLCSYHPSRQNTQTGKLKWPEWVGIFQQARKLIDAA